MPELERPPVDTDPWLLDLFRAILGDPSQGLPFRLYQYEDASTWAVDVANKGTGGKGFRIRNSGHGVELMTVEDSGAAMDVPLWLKQTLQVDGNVGIGVAPHGTYDLTVQGQSWLKDKTGIGGVPDGTDILKVTGLSWFTSRVGIGADADTAAMLKVTGTSWFTSRMGVGADADATVMLKVTGDEWVTGSLGVGATPLQTVDVSGPVRIRSANELRFGGTGASDHDVTLARAAANVLAMGSDDTLRIPSAGTVSIPSVAIRSTDDGLYSPADGSLGVVLNGAEKFTLKDAVQASTAGIGVNIAAPLRPIHAVGSSGALTLPTPGGADVLILENNGNVGLQMFSTTTGVGRLKFSDTDAENRGGVQYNHATDELGLVAAGAVKILIGSNLLGFFAGAGAAKQTVTGTRTGTLAQLQTVMANLLTALAAYSLITDSTS